jgi:hypothetical protein
MGEVMISDDEFARLVAEEVKNKLSPTQRKVLMEPENLDKWKRALIALLDNLDKQLDDLAADEAADHERYSSFGREGKTLVAQAQTAYRTRIAKISRFRFHVSRRLDDVVSMIDGEDTEQTDVWQESVFLRKAISMHKKLIREYDLEETAIDKALWLALDGEWMFDAITVDNI